uniref:Uncharacterized protein n=1 Tax=Glossina pallidipes TaxID=7398 RepID=A0A1A9Z4Z5_GLOPL
MDLRALSHSKRDEYFRCTQLPFWEGIILSIMVPHWEKVCNIVEMAVAGKPYTVTQNPLWGVCPSHCRACEVLLLNNEWRNGPFCVELATPPGELVQPNGKFLPTSLLRERVLLRDVVGVCVSSIKNDGSPETYGC